MKINKKLNAFTLAEALIVMVIIGILMLIALPQFMPLIAKAKSQEAKIQLKYIANLQTQHRYLYSRYSQDFNEIDFEPPLTIKKNGTANYQYTIEEAGVDHFKAKAEAIVDFDSDGVYNVWEITEDGIPREITKD